MPDWKIVQKTPTCFHVFMEPDLFRPMAIRSTKQGAEETRDWLEQYLSPNCKFSLSQFKANLIERDVKV